MMKKILLFVAIVSSFATITNAQNDFKRHELSVSYGYEPASNWVASFSDALVMGFGLKSKNDKCFGVINFAYNYRLSKTWGLGGVFSYSSRKKDWEMDGKNVGTEKYNYVTVMPRVKAAWLHNDLITLYSAAAIGVTVYNDKYNGATESKACFAWQFSPIGIEVGDCIAGYAELGVGQMGVVQAGVRFRF